MTENSAAGVAADSYDAYATYVNASLTGSRFMGLCTVRAVDGQVQVTGHRMPVWLVLVRSLCYLLFVAWIFISIAAVAMASSHARDWQYPVMIAIGLFIVVLLGIGVGDLWAERRGPVQTVTWRAADAPPPVFKYDATVCGHQKQDVLEAGYDVAGHDDLVDLHGPPLR